MQWEKLSVQHFTCIELGVPDESEAARAVQRQVLVVRQHLDVGEVSIGDELVALELELDPPGETVQQQHRLPPGGVQLGPVHRDGGQPAQPEPVNCPEVA